VTWGQLLQICATVVIVGVLLMVVPLGDAGRALKRLEPGWAGIAVVWIIANRVIFIFRWHLLLGPAGVTGGYLQSLVVAMIGYFYNILAPAMVGSDVSRVYLMSRRYGGKSRELAATVLVDRTVGLFSVVVMSLGLLVFSRGHGMAVLLGVLTGCGVVGLAVCWALARWEPRSAEQPESGAVRWARGLMDVLADVARSVVAYRRHVGVLVGALVVSCVGIVTGGMALYSWSRALGAGLSPAQGIAANVFMTVASAVPATVGGLGWSEGAMVVVLGWASIARADALAMALAGRIAGTVLSVLGGLLQFARLMRLPAK
jgi:uncharacterized protein (TIRG00374 family)